MDIKEVASQFNTNLQDAPFIHALKDSSISHIHLGKLHGSSAAVAFAGIYMLQPAKYVVVLRDKEEAAYFYNDLGKLLPEQQVFFLPSSYKQSLANHTGLQYDSGNLIMRTEVLSHFTHPAPGIYVSYPQAVQEKVLPSDQLQHNTITFTTGEEVDRDFVAEILDTFQFEKVDFVYEPGQYAIRGSILDIFSYAHEDPFRVDFFGEEVESIRTFDPSNQLSKAKFEQISVVPNLQEVSQQQEHVSLFSYQKKDLIAGFRDYASFIADAQNHYEKQDGQIQALLSPPKDLAGFAGDLTTIEFSGNPRLTVTHRYAFNTKPQPDYNKNFNLLTSSLLEFQEAGYTVYILSDNPRQFDRLNAIFESETNNKLHFEAVPSTLHEGFIDETQKICVYTDHQIFKRYHKFSLKTQKQSRNKQAMTLKELNSLEVGDYVVHVDHGIAKFGGLQRIEVNGKEQETIRLIYKNNDSLFVNIHSLHKISKYRSKDGTPPKVYKLGSGAWQRLKNNTKKKVKDIAKELINLYAKRRAQKGNAIAPDIYLQDELESSFVYEDTPDQLKATTEMKQDMEAETPMDRLICGDVGFGKTEVAIRGAFKAVNDGKQVAVLVPTTILAYQHYHTFRQRLEQFGCTVDYVSRLRNLAKQRQTLKKLKTGEVDIVIGTHRLVSKDIQFKDLGLLVIDEEQKFGVSVKEKLKAIKVNVDTLTLTATPIPRTLQFSLMGARDLSIINTPPANRYPIVTELHQFNEDIIRDAIEYEMERNGQIYFIHNRVQNIQEIAQYINRTAPEARTVVAHGQMDGQTLEKVMLDFINHDYDVLIATSIIESGLDIPNVNTILINNAHHFGLSDLHQIRGRVGRSNKKAFAYMLAPPLSTMTQDARRRLTAIEEFSELGSGFTIAMRDLDIRGAGDLLGAEQSGFINDIGFETYHRILDEAIMELKETDFKNLFEQEQREKPQKDIRYVTDCQIDTDLALLFPADYIENISERINLYRELDSISNEKDLQKFENQLKDRFGELPEQARDLLDVVRLRHKAIQLGIEKIVLKTGKMICFFVSNPQSPFYQTPTWMQIIQYIQQNPGSTRLKEGTQQLRLVLDQVTDTATALKSLQEMLREAPVKANVNK